jgi:dihydrofolate reductase
MKSMVVAYGRGREMGDHGELPWRDAMRDDLRHFRELTLGTSVIMGYNTYASIGRPLDQRENIVVTKNHTPEDVVVARSLDEAYQRALYSPCVIGGATLYLAAFETAARIYATEIHAEFPDADVFFPELPPEWREVKREQRKKDDRNRYDYDFVEYERDTTV